MMAVPAYKLSGRYTLKSPWVASQTITYKCVELSSFESLIADAEDIFATYYEPKGLTQTEYKADLAAKSTLVTLQGTDGTIIKVPDTYIVSFPNQSIPNYGNYVLSILLGPFREDYDFSFLKTEVGNLVSDTTGTKPTVNVDMVSATGELTAQQAEELEVSREASITNRDTLWARYNALTRQNADLQAKITALLGVVDQ